jgi:acyl carrier protein
VPQIADIVLGALARQLQVPVEELAGRQQEALDRLGLDSHGLMRVLLDIERALKLPASLQLDDAALATPATLVAGVASATGSG